MCLPMQIPPISGGRTSRKNGNFSRRDLKRWKSCLHVPTKIEARIHNPAATIPMRKPVTNCQFLYPPSFSIQSIDN